MGHEPNDSGTLMTSSDRVNPYAPPNASTSQPSSPKAVRLLFAPGSFTFFVGAGTTLVAFYTLYVACFSTKPPSIALLTLGMLVVMFFQLGILWMLAGWRYRRGQHRLAAIHLIASFCTTVVLLMLAA